MTPTQYRAALAALGFAQTDLWNDIGLSEFARWLPCDPRYARRLASGDAAVRPELAKLLRLMLRLKIKPSDVR